MSRAIAAVLRDAALGPTPKDRTQLAQWVSKRGATEGAYWFAMPCRHEFMDGVFECMTNAECRMYLYLCSLAAEGEETEHDAIEELQDAAETALAILRDTVATSDRICLEMKTVRSAVADRLYQRAVVAIEKLQEALK